MAVILVKVNEWTWAKRTNVSVQTFQIVFSGEWRLTTQGLSPQVTFPQIHSSGTTRSWLVTGKDKQHSMKCFALDFPVEGLPSRGVKHSPYCSERRKNIFRMDICGFGGRCDITSMIPSEGALGKFYDKQGGWSEHLAPSSTPDS